jgi:hypothetical protein
MVLENTTNKIKISRICELTRRLAFGVLRTSFRQNPSFSAVILHEKASLEAHQTLLAEYNLKIIVERGSKRDVKIKIFRISPSQQLVH